MSQAYTVSGEAQPARAGPPSYMPQHPVALHLIMGHGLSRVLWLAGCIAKCIALYTVGAG